MLMQKTGKQDIAIADKTSKSYVDTENGKQDVAIADKTNILVCISTGI